MNLLDFRQMLGVEILAVVDGDAASEEGVVVFCLDVPHLLLSRVDDAFDCYGDEVAERSFAHFSRAVRRRISL